MRIALSEHAKNFSMVSLHFVICSCHADSILVQQSFEYSENSSKASASASQFNFVQASFSNRIKSHKIIDRLIQRTSIEAFIEDVVEVEKRLSNGLISDIRQLELELICNAKVSVGRLLQVICANEYSSYPNQILLLNASKIMSSSFVTRFAVRICLANHEHHITSRPLSQLEDLFRKRKRTVMTRMKTFLTFILMSTFLILDTPLWILRIRRRFKK